MSFGGYGDEQDYDEIKRLRQQLADTQQLLAESQAREGGIKLNTVQERWLRNAIRNAYDAGYNDSRTHGSTCGDNAPGYRGRDVERESGSQFIQTINNCTDSTALDAAIAKAKREALLGAAIFFENGGAGHWEIRKLRRMADELKCGEQG